MAYNTLVVQNGIKIINDRAYTAVPTYTIPSRFKVSIATPDVSLSDTSLTTTVPISGTELVSDCSVITGWTCSASDSVSVNSTTFKPDTGADASLNLIKAAVGASTVSADKTTTSVDGTAKDLLIWIYIKDATALAKLLIAGTACEIRFGSDNTNYYYKTYTAADFVVGWNFKKIAISAGFTGTTNSPVIASLDYTYIAFVTNNNADTFSAGDIIFDAIRVASVNDYYKALTSITIDETLGTITAVGILSVSDANGFLIDGYALVNSDGTELLFLKSKFPENSKGTTDLFKFTTKINISNIV